jgi:hypothetical protein
VPWKLLDLRVFLRAAEDGAKDTKYSIGVRVFETPGLCVNSTLATARIV